MDWFPINDPFGTHRRLLLKALEATTGPVLELGMGEESTPYLHDYCATHARDLVSCESEEAWMEKFVQLRGPSHALFLVAKDFMDAPLELKSWSVALIDHDLAIRERDAIRLALNSQITVLHDSDLLSWQAAAKEYCFVREDKESAPFTVALSNYIEL